MLEDLVFELSTTTQSFLELCQTPIKKQTLTKFDKFQDSVPYSNQIQSLGLFPCSSFPTTLERLHGSIK